MAQDLIQCHGLGGMSRAMAIANAQDFCQQGSPVKIYNTGSVDEIQFASWNSANHTKGPQDDSNCYTRLVTSIIDGCDGTAFANYTHNDTLTGNDAWYYDMQPLGKQLASREIAQNNCEISHRGFFLVFEIRGRGFRKSTLVPNGLGLRHALGECGIVGFWRFRYTPEDCCYEWYASGSLPPWAQSCVADRIEWFGGQRGNCGP